MAIKISLKKLSLRDVSANELGALPDKCGFDSLPFSVAAAARVLELPFHHHDPFDRALVAQAQTAALVLVTHDDTLGAYDVQLLLV